MRLYLYLKNALDLTRSEVTKLNDDNRIVVNGKKVNLTYDVLDNDIVMVDDRIIEKEPFVYYLYNKPIGVICTNNKDYAGSIKNHLCIKERVYPIGRLDKLSRGLLILTNDAKFCHDVLSTHFEKEYIVKVEKVITDEFIKSMPDSIMICGKETLPCSVKKIDEYHFSIILREGRYHQIRRMVTYHGNKVVDLKRIRIGNIKLDTLEEGSYIRINDLPNMI